jgi:hypothetical protein
MSQLGNASNYQIAGGLNFGSVPSQTDYQGAYANALSLNTQNYNNILAGYQGLGQSQTGAQNQIQQGYGQLQGQVANTIQGIDASQRQAISDTYANQSGTASQGLISRGLGNTTVANSVQRGLTLDNQKANIALSNQTAQLSAGYQSSLGLAGLNYANQANMQNTALGSQQLGFMNSVNSPYPNASAYADRSLQAQTLALATRAANSGGQQPRGVSVNMPGGQSPSMTNRAPGSGTGAQAAGAGGGSGGGSGGTPWRDPNSGADGGSGYTDGYGNPISGADMASLTGYYPSAPAQQPSAWDYGPPTPDNSYDSAGWGGDWTGGTTSRCMSHDDGLFEPDLPQPPGNHFMDAGGALSFGNSRKRRARQKKKFGKRGKGF